MKYAKINMIDVASGKMVLDTVVLPYSFAFLTSFSSNQIFKMEKRFRLELEEVKEDQFDHDLFLEYMNTMEDMQCKIDIEDFYEALSQTRSSRSRPDWVNCS